MSDTIGPMPKIDQRHLARQLVEEGANLVSPDGMLTGLTKNVLESVLEAEISEPRL